MGDPETAPRHVVALLASLASDPAVGWAWSPGGSQYVVSIQSKLEISKISGLLSPGPLFSKDVFRVTQSLQPTVAPVLPKQLFDKGLSNSAELESDTEDPAVRPSLEYLQELPGTQ